MAGDQLVCGVAIPMLAPASCAGEFLLGLEQGKLAYLDEIFRKPGVHRRSRYSGRVKHLVHPIRVTELDSFN
jgi:hypothetical protein